MKKDTTKINPIPILDTSFSTSYVQHEVWFEIRDIHKQTGEKGKLIMNSYGRVREVYEDGTFHDIHDGKQI